MTGSLRLLAFLVSSLSAALLPMAAPAAPAQPGSEVTDLATQIDMAGRQRMLSQRLTAAACLVTLGVNPEQQHLALTETMEVFGVSLDRMEKGYPLIHMPAVSDPIARASLGAQRLMWSQVSPLAATIRDYGNSPSTMKQLAELEPVLLQSAQSLVQSLRRGATATPEEAAQIKAVDIAGRQRMLAYKMLKDACLITTEARAGRETETLRQNLEATLDLFELSAGQLVAGDEEAQIAEPPNDQVFAALDAVQLRWQDLRPMLEPALEGEALGPAALGDLAYDYDALLFDLEEVVWYYTLE